MKPNGILVIPNRERLNGALAEGYDRDTSWARPKAADSDGALEGQSALEKASLHKGKVIFD